MNKQLIQVRQYPALHNHYSTNEFQVVEVIQRKPWLEQIGNFAPMFCRYNRKKYLVHSDEGDLSDPFRADDTYLANLFIEL